MGIVGQELMHILEQLRGDLIRPGGIPGSAIGGQLTAGSGGPLPPGGNTGTGYTPGAHTHALTDLEQDGATAGQVLTWDDIAGAWAPEDPSAGVTSVGLTMPTAIFDVTGSPVTGAGTLAVTLDTQSANTVLAGPGTGAAAAPSFRALVAADLPAEAVRRASSGVAGRVAYWTGASEIGHESGFFYDATNNRLGLGTDTPGLDLHIVNSSDTAYTGIFLNNTHGSSRRWAVAGNPNNTSFGPAKAFIIRDVDAGATRITIDTSGNTGIGTTTPTAKLDVSGGYLRALQDGSNTPPTAGRGIELVGTANTGFLISIDRTGGGAVNQPLNVIASNIILRAAATVGGTNVAPTRSLTLDNASNTYVSWNVSGTEKWVLGLETTLSDRLVLYYSPGGYYAFIVSHTPARIDFAGIVNVPSWYYVNGTPVVRSPAGGWGTPTGGVTRATFDIATVTLPQLAQRVSALIQDLKLHHGLLAA